MSAGTLFYFFYFLLLTIPHVHRLHSVPTSLDWTPMCCFPLGLFQATAFGALARWSGGSRIVPSETPCINVHIASLQKRLKTGNLSSASASASSSSFIIDHIWSLCNACKLDSLFRGVVAPGMATLRSRSPRRMRRGASASAPLVPRSCWIGTPPLPEVSLTGT
ncbi:hypothetical protein LZ30DRAFT_207831 [Colletotrichum cereale]|nr:hypothetical protein LZ30DRAFT_207831 [Colletotrichum cereale]